MTSLKLFCTEDTGQDLLEYSLIVALIGFGSVVAFKSLSTQVGSVFTAVGTAMTSGI